MMKTYNMTTKALASLAAICTLTGCSFFTPVKTDAQNEYSLNKVPSLAKSRYKSHKILAVMPTTAAPYYRTTRIAYQTSPYKVSYYGKNEWAELPSQMLQPLLVQALSDTNRFRAVVTPPLTGRYDYMLTTEILNLRVNYLAKPARFEVKLRAQVISSASNKVIATMDISRSHAIPDGPFQANIMTANQVVAKVIASLTQSTLRAIK